MELQSHVSARRQLQVQAVERFAHITHRSDWEALATELYERVIYRCPYAVAVIHKKKLARWHRLVIRTNDTFEPSEFPLFIRRTIRVAHYDAIFKSTRGMERHDRYDLYKVIDGHLGLPINSLVFGIQHDEQPDLKMLLVFGGERLEGHMERSLEMLQKVLAATPTNRHQVEQAKTAEDYGSYGELIAELRGINLKELDKMDLRDISSLVNGLDAVIEYSPASLRAKFRALNDHLLARRRLR